MIFFQKNIHKIREVDFGNFLCFFVFAIRPMNYQAVLCEFCNVLFSGFVGDVEAFGCG